MATRFKRLGIAVGTLLILLFGLSGAWRDAWLWTYVAVCAVAAGYALLTIDEDLARERFSPPAAGADRVALGFIRVAAIAHLAVGALDSGRWHLTPVTPAVRVVGLFLVATMFALFFGAMRTNRFFSAVVRIQDDRGHRVVDRGLYSIVRHPGYAGLILGIPSSGLALGSWLSAGIGLIMSALILRRVLFEDAFLRANLEGYPAYAARVPHRLIPGLW
jgi:protein-S-isoprenylcysteine O-methyltransferase Ste14